MNTGYNVGGIWENTNPGPLGQGSGFTTLDHFITMPINNISQSRELQELKNNFKLEKKSGDFTSLSDNFQPVFQL